MRLPNGFGSVYKLSGKRRNPWIARKTCGWSLDEKTQKVKQNYITVGYYPTRQAALMALTEYNKDPYDVGTASMSLSELYERWSAEHYESISVSNIQGSKAAWALCASIKDMKLSELKLDHFQMVVDCSGKNTPSLRKLKVLLGLMYDYAVKHEILPADKRNIIRYLNISKPGNPNAYNRKPFTKAQIQTVWRWQDSSPYIKVILILIYTGVRIGELLDLKKENIDLKEKCFDIVASKTQAGIRKVPIADKVFPLFCEWYYKNDCEYLISTPEGKHFEYRNYYDSYWKPFMSQMGIEHRPHDTRHTCVSLLAAAGVDERVIKKIVGHKGQGVTQTVYTHFEVDELLDAINKI